MKNLSAKNQKELSTKVNQFIDLTFKKDLVKADKVKTFCVEKFSKDNFESVLAGALEIIAQQKTNQLVLTDGNVNAIDITHTDVAQDALSNADGISEAEINHDLLNALNALGISDTIKENGSKSIFKKEFNNKADRTKCRNSFQNAIALYLLHLAKNKLDLANDKLNEVKSIASKYYIAECAFKDKAQYCTDNMEDKKKELIAIFISSQQSVAVD